MSWHCLCAPKLQPNGFMFFACMIQATISFEVHYHSPDGKIGNWTKQTDFSFPLLDNYVENCIDPKMDEFKWDAVNSLYLTKIAGLCLMDQNIWIAGKWRTWKIWKKFHGWKMQNLSKGRPNCRNGNCMTLPKTDQISGVEMQDLADGRPNFRVKNVGLTNGAQNCSLKCMVVMLTGR